MASSIFFGGSVIAAIVAGMIPLYAPCCISVMLPAYFASSFHNRRILVAMTFLFAAGVASIILPLALGANLLRQLFIAQHTPIYVTAGVLMVSLGVYVLLGGQIHLPMPGRRASSKAGPISVYSLGLFSGVATSCCAPVLAGVIALSGAASSFVIALGLGAAYVFGMVAPLFVIALLWERFDWRASPLFRPRSFCVQVGNIRYRTSVTNIVSGSLLTIMGVATTYVGFRGASMGRASGWQADRSWGCEQITPSMKSQAIHTISQQQPPSGSLTTISRYISRAVSNSSTTWRYKSHPRRDRAVASAGAGTPFEGLSKYLISREHFAARTVAQALTLLDGCGGRYSLPLH